MRAGALWVAFRWFLLGSRLPPDPLGFRSHYLRVGLYCLSDEIERIKAGARTRARQRNFAVTTSLATGPDFEIPKSGISVRSLARYLLELTGKRPVSVSGEMVVAGEPHLIIRAANAPPERIPVDTTNIERSLHQAARYVTRVTDPYSLASYLDRSGETADARKTALYMLRTNPATDDVLALNLLGILHEREGRPDDAHEAYELATAADNMHQAPLVNRARLLFNRHSFDAAERLLEKASARDGEYTAVLYNNWGEIRYIRRDFKGAREKFERAIRAEPTYFRPYWNLANTLAKERK